MKLWRHTFFLCKFAWQLANTCMSHMQISSSSLESHWQLHIFSASRISKNNNLYIQTNIHQANNNHPWLIDCCPHTHGFSLSINRFPSVFQSIYHTQLWSVSICQTSSQTFIQEWAGTFKTCGQTFHWIVPRPLQFIGCDVRVFVCFYRPFDHNLIKIQWLNLL